MVINQRQLEKQKLNLKPQGIFLFARLLLTLLSFLSWQPCLFQREVGKEAK